MLPSKIVLSLYFAYEPRLWSVCSSFCSTSSSASFVPYSSSLSPFHLCLHLFFFRNTQRVPWTLRSCSLSSLCRSFSTAFPFDSATNSRRLFSIPSLSLPSFAFAALFSFSLSRARFYYFLFISLLRNSFETSTTLHQRAPSKASLRRSMNSIHPCVCQ